MRTTSTSLGRSARLVRTTTLVALLTVIGMLGSCSRGETSASRGTTDETAVNELEPDETPQRGGTLKIGVMAEAPGFNPIYDLWADAANFVGSTVLEPLMVYDRDGTPVPWLAESVTEKVPGRFDAWVIKIRPGISFHNGEPLDAAAVKLNLDKATSVSLAAIATKEMFSGFEVIDSLTIEAKLTREWSGFPGFLGNVSGYMVAPEMLRNDSDHYSRKPIGTGPFVFTSWSPGASFKARRNPDYWRKDSGPYLDEIEFVPIIDNQQRTQALESGDVDMIFTISAGDVSILRDRFRVVTDFNSEKSFIMLNTGENPAMFKNPFKSIHARKAVAYATDRDRLKQIVAQGVDLETTTAPQVSTTRWRMDEADTGALGFDPAKAREEIERYKQETGETKLSFRLTGQPSSDDRLLTQTLQQMWEEVGMEVELETLEQAQYITNTAVGNFQAASFRNYAYKDPDQNYYFFHSSTAKGVGNLSINFHQLIDPAIDRDLEEARKTLDFDTRKQLYDDMTRRINEHVVDIWLFNTPYSLIAADYVRGLNPAHENGFGNFLPKSFLWAGVWKKRS